MKAPEKSSISPAGAGLIRGVWEDPRLRAVHICLYAAIAFHCQKTGQNQIRISRRILMRYARIKSFATYHRCIRDLASFGLIDYHPSFHPLRASRILLSGKDAKDLKDQENG